MISTVLSSGYQSASERKPKPQQPTHEDAPVPTTSRAVVLSPGPVAEFAFGIEAAMVETLSEPELMRSRLLRAKKISAYSDAGLPPSQLVSRVT